MKAQEISEAKRSTTAKLAITVKPVDANPPEIVMSSTEGFVNENSPVGTNVLDSGGNPLIVTVEDKDFVRKNVYDYIITHLEVVNIIACVDNLKSDVV